MLIESFSLSELGIFIGAVCAALSGVVYSVQKSRCNMIKCGCIECDRNVLDTPDAVNPDI